MPFTFSHPVAVLPLVRGLRGRGPLVASALVAGSMAPDLPFFAGAGYRALHRGHLAHRWWAVPTVDVALAGALLLGWRAALREPLLGLLPPQLAGPAATATAARGERPHPAAFVLSAAIGAATHVGLDAFTHRGGPGVRLVPALARPVAGVPLCTVLQYGGSALALVGLGRHLRGELGRIPPEDRLPVPAASRPRRAALAAAAVLGSARHLYRSPRTGLDHRIADACFGAGAGLTAGAAALTLADRLTARARYRPEAFG
ncbi:DUF4184 family protein [Kitasatospora viridis]|uniref:Uncharacterized protein DUF4184 n=1 Tax=Kitasatospora viridis TaxID=281105 RepID=A0A561UP13_9ACTN|nr:DUF4184 family protein [Kitasatospora viridis]TWG01090.1 uncharacterized protein DUF4184 [Kitasatospora viridis]